ncbi:hypothetical protein AAHE18_17G093700 [Arachis hypogaea]
MSSTATDMEASRTAIEARTAPMGSYSAGSAAARGGRRRRLGGATHSFSRLSLSSSLTSDGGLWRIGSDGDSSWTAKQHGGEELTRWQGTDIFLPLPLLLLGGPLPLFPSFFPSFFLFLMGCVFWLAKGGFTCCMCW